MITYFKDRQWLMYSVLAALCWGIWGVLAKFVASDISPYTNHLLFSVGMMFTLPFILKKCTKAGANSRGIVWGLLAGVLAIAGNVAVYKSFATGGLAAVVIPVTNLYPVVTIIIALLVFQEKMHWLNGIGLLIIIPAIVMLSGQTQLFHEPSLFLRSLGLKAWLLFALVALFFWGLFSAAQKVATNYISAEWSYVSFIISSVIIAGLFIAFHLTDLQFTQQTFWIGSLAGMLNGLGVLASFAAYRAEGKASKVTTIAGALQPMFTILFALLFLKEKLGVIECIGIALAVIGALFLSVENKKGPLLKTDSIQPTTI